MYVFLVFISVIIVLLLVVGIHELGHALAAYIFNVKINKISIGFGRPLFKWKSRSDIEWIWALWPLGGYVQLLNTRIEPVSKKYKNQAFDQKSALIRIIIILAGIVANLLVAFIANLLIFMIGYKQTPPVILDVKPQSIAAFAGFKKADMIVSIANNKTPSLRDSAMELIKNLGNNKVLVVLNSNGHIHSTFLNLKKWKYQGGKNALFAGIGIIPDTSSKFKQYVKGNNFFVAALQSLLEIKKLFCFFLVVLKKTITGVLPFAVLLGPIGLFETIANSFLQGVVAFLYLLATLSVSVALINILPVPGLDGGAIFYTIIEKIRGKPISIAMEVLLYRLVFIVFAVLLVQLLLNDLKRYIAYLM